MYKYPSLFSLLPSFFFLLHTVSVVGKLDKNCKELHMKFLEGQHIKNICPAVFRERKPSQMSL
ncbi:unnamed protein product [Periconia digitata]|uniref:Secreted protein n=1 Tax=Periconia digitata TaxID=1303443 RepID=A0A9W4UI99_9PLEO|nr:unnamed protein product [Periconia digitata]